MATEGQVAALGNWLKVAVSEELQFDMASSALARLHKASETYNKDKKKNKGVITSTKKAIIKELREAGYLIEDKDQKQIDEKPEGQSLNGAIKQQEENEIWDKTEETAKEEEKPSSYPKYKQAIVDEISIDLQACTLAAKKSIETDYNDLDLTSTQKGAFRKEIAATILIQAKRGGL